MACWSIGNFESPHSLALPLRIQIGRQLFLIRVHSWDPQQTLTQLARANKSFASGHQLVDDEAGLTVELESTTITFLIKVGQQHNKTENQLY